MPAWRSEKLGWVLLHVGIGLLALGFLQLLLVGAILTAAGRDTEEIEDAVAALSLLPVLGGLAGWLFFVYLRRGIVLRLAVVAVALVPPLVGAIAGGLALQPRA